MNSTKKSSEILMAENIARRETLMVVLAEIRIIKERDLPSDRSFLDSFFKTGKQRILEELYEIHKGKIGLYEREYRDLIAQSVKDKYKG